MEQAATVRRARGIARALAAPLGAVIGVFYAGFVISNAPGLFSNDRALTGVTVAGAAVVGAAALALAAPLLTVEPYLWLERSLDSSPPAEVVAALAGVLGGLVLAALVAVLLGPLPMYVGTVVSVVLAVALTRAGARVAIRRRHAFTALWSGGRPRAASSGSVNAASAPIDGPPVVVDTSVLIDGRIADVARSGFVPGRLLLAGFMLEELQRVADAGDPMRRARGRRGLTVLEELKRRADVAFEVVDDDFPDIAEVDTRLVKLALARGALLLTTDHNLNRVAQVAGVRVLNLNDLANALKPILSAGEEIAVSVVREGKELHQGVGYLDDGTMVVVENARGRLGDTVRATVTSVLQTSAGRMIFAMTDSPEPARVGRPARSRATR